MSGDLLTNRPFHSMNYFIPSGISKVPPGLATICDEVDNNTYYMQTEFKPLYVMNDIFHREDERLKTFESWPLDWLNKKELAATGMFYMGECDKTKCYFCEVEIGRWERNDQPVSEHLRWSPNCPLLRRRTTNNVPINSESLERLLPPPSYDICGHSDSTAVGVDIPPELPTLPSSSNNGSSSSSSNSGQFYPEFPEYAIESARLRSFSEWPKTMKQKPAQLVEAGFFYTGVGDRVKCFSCGGGLKDWNEDDEPWTQHALWMNKCRYVKLMKGESYIEAVLNKFKRLPTENDDENETRNVDINTAAINTMSAAASDDNAELKQSEIQQLFNVTQTVLTNCGSEEKKSCTDVQDDKLCKICYVEKYNTVFLPCGHIVACAKCASSVTKCPMCRKPFANVMRVYFS